MESLQLFEFPNGCRERCVAAIFIVSKTGGYKSDIAQVQIFQVGQSPHFIRQIHQLFVAA
jgi:hypothetical protein